VKQNNKFLCLVLIAALICNLGQNKMEQLSPFPQSNDESAKEQKRAILASLKWGGRGGPDVPFILSKIVALFSGLATWKYFSV